MASKRSKNLKQSEEVSKITLYHYTTEDGLHGIKKSRIIRQSRSKGPNRDAAFGDGVYLTSLSPRTKKVKLALNNWDGNIRFAEEMIEWGKVECYIKLDIDDDEVEEIEAGNRDIFLYPGDLLITEDMNMRSGLVSKKK